MRGSGCGGPSGLARALRGHCAAPGAVTWRPTTSLSFAPYYGVKLRLVNREPTSGAENARPVPLPLAGAVARPAGVAWAGRTAAGAPRRPDASRPPYRGSGLCSPLLRLSRYGIVRARILASSQSDQLEQYR